MSSSPPLVHIHYLRPPNRREVFRQRLVLDDPEVKVTLARDVSFDSPIRIHGQIVLETGSDAVWFTFPDRWHDVGRFHRADGTFTGLYANILTPPLIQPGGIWETTDLFLDLWIDSGGELSVLDEDQLEEALERGWITPSDARRAREEITRILKERKRGRWPPPTVEEWTLDRALEALDEWSATPRTRPSPAPDPAAEAMPPRAGSGPDTTASEGRDPLGGHR